MNYFHDIQKMIFRTIKKLITCSFGFEQTVNCHILHLLLCALRWHVQTAARYPVAQDLEVFLNWITGS